jgi:hypothetical protein
MIEYLPLITVGCVIVYVLGYDFVNELKKM